MRLAPVPYSNPAEREMLKPKVGDVVLFEGTKYVVEQVGLKYAGLHLESDSRIKGLAKMTQISKWFAMEEDEPEKPLNLINQEGDIA